MARKSDLRDAFVAAVHKKPKGYQCLHTADFIRELRARNWHFTEKDANDWIERYQAGFVDKHRMTAKTDSGSCETWGISANGLRFASGRLCRAQA